MSDWNSGYVTDIGYTYGYYAELNPLRVKLAFLNAGLHLPESGTACELGFGQGVSVNMHAAASITEWHGTDFNPSQAAFAQSLARASGAPAHLSDEAFAEFCGREDLPQFDYIGLHGIWSWISDENRAVIVDFARRKLKVGGVLYISYNTQPGWAAMVPLRHLMTEFAATMGSSGQGTIPRVDAAIQFTDRLLSVDPAYARTNPLVKDRFTKLKEQNRNYLAHEYFNRDWLPMPFAAMAKWLEPAKLSYACSAHMGDHVDPLNLTPDQQAFLKEIPDANFRETARDYVVNQGFRRDYWVKGPRTMTSLEQLEAWRALHVMLIVAREDVKLTAPGSLGEAGLQESVYTPLLDLLAGHKPMEVVQLELALGAQHITRAQLWQALLVLHGKGDVVLVQDDRTQAKAKPRCDALNKHLLHQARGGAIVDFLASPVTGGGIVVARFFQLMLLERGAGKKKPEDWVDGVWSVLASQNQRLIKEGTTIETAEANIAELRNLANDFQEKRLPILRALGITN